MAIVKKKKKVITRIKTGLAGAPTDTFERFKSYIHTDIDKKVISTIIKDYINQTCSKEDQKYISACPEYVFTMKTHIASCIHWKYALGNTFTPRTVKNGIMDVEIFYDGDKAISNFLIDSIAHGKSLIKETPIDAKPIIVISPKERLLNKINETVMVDLDLIEDSWIDNQKDVSKLDLYAVFKGHGLTGASVPPVKDRLLTWLSEYSDAFNKTCEQATEAYSHIIRRIVRKRIENIQAMLGDLDKVLSASKAVRKTRVVKPKSVDKQLEKLKYQKESLEYKLSSIQASSIIGAMRLFVFNSKTREISEYISTSSKGFEVKGTTLQNISDESRKTKLRKPEEFLTITQKKTIKQIDLAWKNLTTKITIPNGRINSDTIILRAIA